MWCATSTSIRADHDGGDLRIQYFLRGGGDLPVQRARNRLYGEAVPHRGRRGADAYSSSSREDCEEWGEKNYWHGKEVRVHYDPRDPGEAALEPGVSQTSIWFIIIGSLLAGPACFMAMFALPENRRPSIPIRILFSLAAILIIGGINILAFPGDVSR